MHFRCLGLLVLLGLGTWGLAQKPAVPVAEGLEVHEWGVFRVHRDLDLANADMKAIWDGLPKFIYGQVNGRQLPKHWQNLEIRDRPIVYFRTPKALEVQMKVEFPGGVPAVWWPGTQYPAIRQGNVIGPAPKAGAVADRLEWKLHLKEPPKVRRALAEPAVETSHWFQTLRNVKADDVFALVGEANFGYEREKFVYYDGLFPAGKWLDLKFEKERVGVVNRAKDPVHDVTVVDRQAGKVRVARLSQLAAGAEVQNLEFVAAEANRWPQAGIETLAAQLQGAGLNADEAKSLIELWKDELFLTEGVTLFYRIPQEVYERLLPLTLQPRPEKLVRVGLMHHAHCEPDLAERVARLLKDLDSNDFGVRQAAQRRLEEMGRAAYVILARKLKDNPPLELRMRIEQIIGKHAVESALPKN
ncbi:MAG: hypothetical protein JNM56_07015 [Planctomycetia bacterium]|nr:hypothetical protein [Planctomycetia bacterium]